METVSNGGVAEIRSELQRIVQSRFFEKALRSQRFLSYLVEAAIAEPPVPVNEYAVALDVFDRSPTYDPSVDATVRVEAGRLRGRLREYYTGEGKDAEVVIDIPKGHYAAVFSRKAVGAATPEDGSLDRTAESALEMAASRIQVPTDPKQAIPQLANFVHPGWHLWRGGIALLVCLGSVLVTFNVLRRGELKAASSVHSMAVLPLRNLSGSSDQNYLAEGMTDELNTELARIPHLRVISHNSVMSVRLEGKPLKQVAKELDVDTVVEGSLFRYGDKIRINAQLTDVRDDRQLWAASLEGNAKDLIALEDSVAREIASHARLVFPSETQLQGMTAEHPSPDAYDAYLRARYFLDKRDPKLSTVYFQRAIDLDPTFASAYGGLAEALEAAMTLGSARPEEAKFKALASARKALELDPRNGRAYAALGTIELTQLWDWPRAEQDLLRGIELSPGDSFPLTMYGLLLDATHHPEEAVARMRQATMIDPLSFFASRNLGSALYYARRYDEALPQLERAKELQPDRSGVVDNWIGWTYEMKGVRDEAVRYNLNSLRRGRPGYDIAPLLRTYQTEGWKAYWRSRLRNETSEPVRECASYERAVDYLRVGDSNSAITLLQQAFDQHCYWMEMIGVDPRFDPLRREPRFEALARRMNPGLAHGE